MVVYSLHQRGKDKSLGQSKLVDQASADLLKSAVAVTIIFIITIGLFFNINIINVKPIQVFHTNFWLNFKHINYSSEMDICFKCK